jgi:hypothetical protein
MKMLTSLAIYLATPLIVAALSFAIAQWSKAQWAKLDAAGPVAKQTYVAAWALVLNAITDAVGHSVCVSGAAYCDLPDVAFKTVISYAIAVSLHGAKKRKAL